MARIYQHTPVLLQEVLALLSPQRGQVVVDCTLGGGGYTEALAQIVGPKGRVLALDLDSDALSAMAARMVGQPWADRVILRQGNFADIESIARRENIIHADGVVADLGFSSYELDKSGRGFSFQKDEPLDMRFDPASARRQAADILAEAPASELVRIFHSYGEEPFAKSIAREVVQIRAIQPLKTTAELRRIITASLPERLRYRAADSCRRVFQALRIAVNNELDNLQKWLPAAMELLAVRGVMAAVSFQSLEDRLVKQFFVAQSKSCICPPELPQCVCSTQPALQILTKKPIIPSADELLRNPRAKPAKLRAARKLTPHM